MSKKYEFIKEVTHNIGGRQVVLHQIRALKDFGYVKAGEVGGWIETEDNLSHKGNCWIYDASIVCDNATVLDNATVSGNTVVCDNAYICDNATVSEYAIVCDNAIVLDNAKVSGKARIQGTAEISGKAVISGTAYIDKPGDYYVVGPLKDGGYLTTYYNQNATTSHAGTENLSAQYVADMGPAIKCLAQLIISNNK